jgi:putative phosphoesterase
MQIAILSDIHDNVWKLDAALKRMQDAELLICCGDLCSPFIVGLLADGFAHGPLHIVFGNNDADLFRITQNANRYAGRVTIHGAFAELTLDGKRFAVNHYPEIAVGLAASGKYDVICFGHNHRYEVTRYSSALAINPGPIMGYDPGSKQNVDSTFVLYDTETDTALRCAV